MAKSIGQFITTCTLTFKTFEYDVTETKNKANPWHFTAINPTGDKKYQVYCAPDQIKAAPVVKAILSRIPKGVRLVVVCMAHSQEEQEQAQEENYTLISISTLKQYGDEMLEILEREASENKDVDVSKLDHF